ncbi:guanylate-binding protein 3-like isoform 1-T1 [Discoglossus pictus]
MRQKRKCEKRKEGRERKREKEDRLLQVTMAPVPMMTSPICLIENKDGNKICVNPEAKRILEKISQPLVVVSIVGPYRSGKSYLMNNLAKIKKGGFPLGHTVEAKTKGIWMLCVPHPKKRDHMLVLLDTEGLGDVQKGDTRNDFAILTLSVLLSSAMVYNSSVTIDYNAVKTLYDTVELCEWITNKTSHQSEDEEDMEGGSLVPLFVWVVRDFSLSLELQGRPITADEYLENSLQDITSVKGMQAMQRNNVRKTLRTRFPERKCFVFESPLSNTALLKKMEQVSHSQLEPGFVEQTISFCQFIYEKAEAKSLDGGLVVNGCFLGRLLDSYVKVADSKQMSALVDSMRDLYSEHNRSVMQTAADLYTKHMRSNEVNTKEGFLDIHEVSKEMAFKHFKDNAVTFKEEMKEFQELIKILERHKDEIWKNCETSSRKKCQDLTKRLSGALNKDIQENKYHIAGGHQKFVTDKEKLIDKYIKEPGKGVMAQEVLQEFLKSLEDVEKIILQCDLVISEKYQRPQLTDRSNFSQLINYVRKYKLEDQSYQRILIQLFGYAGHGKSSFVNSCQYVIGNEEFKDHAGEAESYGGKTIDRRGYKLTDYITIVDNRGFGRMDSSETWEVYAQLCNLVPLNTYVRWDRTQLERLDQLKQNYNTDPDLIVPVFVYSAEQAFNGQESANIKEFLKNAQKLTNILPFIIITHTFSENTHRVERSFHQLGMENVYTVDNYVQEDHVRTRGRHMPIVTFLVDVLDAVDFHFQDSATSRRQQHQLDKKGFLLGLVSET